MAPEGVLQKVVASLRSVGEFELSEIRVTPKSSAYKAVERKLRRALVIKLMPLAAWGSKGSQISAMAAAERRIVKGFDYPNVPRLLTGGETDDHLFWITEFVDGLPLDKTIALKETMSPLDLVDMARQLCASVESTSKSGIVHHRFCPRNLVAEWDGTLKVLDWGVPPYSEPTASETLASSHYFAPEQLAGQIGDVRSNLFSVGVILYQLATAKLPYQGATTPELKAAMDGGAPTNPSELNRKIPPGISAPLLKALSRSPNERYHSASELIRDLENFKKYGVKEELPASFHTRKTETAPKAFAPPSGSGPMDATMELDAAWTPAVTAPVAREAAAMSRYAAAVAIADSTVQMAPLPEVVEPPKTVTETVYQEPELKPVPPSKAQVALKKIKPPKVTIKDVTRAANKIPPLTVALVLAVAVLALFIWKIVVPYTITRNIPKTSVQVEPAPVQQPTVAEPEQPQSEVAEQAPAEPEVSVRSFGASPRKGKKNKTAPVAAPIAPVVGELYVSSEPNGATFQVDGRSDSSFVTPFTVAQLTPGRHVVTFSKPGYQIQSLTTDVSAGSRATVVGRLAVEGAMLTIASRPTGANIFIDGKETGKATPAQFIVSKAQHSVALKLPGYLEATVPVNLSDGQNHSVSPELVAMGRTIEIKTTKKGFFGIGGRGDKDMGKVNIRTQPDGAAVMINGQLAPKATPLEISLNPGGYELVFQLRGYKSHKKVIVVEAGSKMAIDESLQPEQ